mgnify:CR=1 FL=1
MRAIKLTLTTDASGNATVTAERVFGRVYAVQLVDGTFDDGVDLTLTCENLDLSIPILAKLNFNTDQMVYPRVACALNTDGTALTVYDMPLAAGDLKAVIAQGGNAKSGSVIVFLLEE